MADAPAYTPSVPTIRISNIPQPISRDDLEKYLQDLDSPLGTIAVNTAGQTYISLAPEASEGGNQRFQVATVTFSKLIDGKIPPVVKLGPPGATFEATVDTHFRGLTPLNNSEKPTIDIIAVTGLAGHAFGSWRSPERYGMWLRDFHARIYDFSKQFIEAVKGARSRCHSRPLVLIGHSLGGLVIKEAIIQCFDSKDSTLGSIAGILFFSVPHKGLADASLLFMVHGQPNENLVRDLCEGSQFLHVLDRSFGYHMNLRGMGTNIISFYETNETPTVKEVGPGKWGRSGPCVRMVTHESIKHAAGGGEGLPMDANHSSIVKFKDRSDQRYQLVCSKLLGITRTISIGEEETKVPCEERVKICEWLHPGVVDRKHKQISGRRQEGTGGWLPADEKFMSWRCGSGPRLLWGCGIPGAGKTFLSSLVIDVLDAHSRACSSTGLAYFYFDYMDQNEQIPIAVLRVLIKQLIARPRALNAPIPTLVRSLYDKNCAAGTTPEIKDLQDALTASLALFKETFFVFDALDECREDLRKQLLSLIHWISGSGTRIFLTSRPYHDISISLNPSTSNSHVEKVELAAKEEDVIIYVQKTIQGHDDAGELIKDDLRLNVISKLVDACKGMFLLVDFYIKDLCEYTTVGGVKNALDGIGPAIGTEKALHDTYGKVMDNIRAQHKSRSRLALKVLTWLLTADCTLPVDELRMAVAMGDGGQVGNPKPFNEAEMAGKSLILTVCRGLVMHDQNSDTIKFVHYSVHEYLEKTCTLGDLASRHLTVAFGCLEHLWFSYIEPHPRRHFLQDDGGLVDYARRRLHTHIQASHHIAAAEVLLRFLRNPGLMMYLGVLEYSEYPTCNLRRFRKNHHAYGPLREATAWGSIILINCLLEERTGPDETVADRPLHIAAGENRVDLVRFWLGKGVGVNATDPNGETPLAYAIRLRSIDAARELLSSGADLTAVLQARGWKHSEVRDPAMLELLLEFGLSVDEKVDIKSWYNTGPERYIIHAIRNGDTDVVELLLRKGASIHARCPRGRTALHVAFIEYRTQIARLLLQHGYGGPEEREEEESVHSCSHYAEYGHKPPPGILVDARDRERKTPLHYAAENGSPDMIRLLLSHGRDGTPSGQRVRAPRVHEHAAAINSRDNDGLTVLDLATRYSEHMTVMVPMLLGAGADLTVPPCTMLGSITWLHRAAALGDAALLKAALNAGVDPHARDHDNRSPLHLAAYNGSVEMVSLLMEKGLTVDLRDNGSKTPLHYARGAAIIAMLIERGASASPTDVSGNTPLHSRLEYEHTCEDSWTSEMISEEVLLLVQAGAGVNVQNKSGVTPLHLAAALGLARPVSLLLECGADIGALDVNQMSAMHHAATSSRGPDAISLLMERGLSIEGQDIDQRTPLHHAALDDSSVKYIPLLVRLLGEKGASVDPRDKDWFTPLNYLFDHHIWYDSTTHAARMLIQAGADVNVHGGGVSFMHLATKRGDTDMLRLLVEAGADIHAHDIKKQTQLHHAVLGHSNAHPSDIYTLYSSECDDTCLWIRVAKTLISLGAHVNAADEEQNTPLHMAAQQGAKELLVLLLDAGADIHAHNSKKQTPLHRAVLGHSSDHLERWLFTKCDNTCSWISVAKTLISLGAHVNAADEEQNTPLHMAAQQGAKELLVLLLDAGADIHAHNSKKQTPLHRAVLGHSNYHLNRGFPHKCENTCSWISVAKTLISLGTHVNAVDEEQNTPLHMAAQQGAEELLVLLLDAGADIHAQNSKKQTPLHHVFLAHSNCHFNRRFSSDCHGSWCSWTCVAKKLISLGAHVNAVDEEQNTPLHMAAQQGAEELLVLFLDAGAAIYTHNSKKQTLLHHVVLGHRNYHLNRRSFHECDDTCSWTSVAKTLISLGAHVNAVDEEQNTPLHLAAQQGAKELLVLLLNAGADINAQNSKKQTPLHHVVLGPSNYHLNRGFFHKCDNTCSWISVAKTLISLGAHVNAVDDEQNTPLHLAAQNSSKEMIVLLLDAGADRHACNCSQETRLDIAIQYGLSADITEMLVDQSSEHRPAIEEKTGDQGVEVIEMEIDDASCGSETPSQDPEDTPTRKRKYSIAFPPRSN